MYAYSSLFVIACRRRWRFVMLLCHIFLMLFSLILLLVMVFGVSGGSSSAHRSASLLALIAVIGCYGGFGVVVYWRCRYLLRLLSIASVLLIIIVTLSFVGSVLATVSCRHSDALQIHTNTTQVQCQTRFDAQHSDSKQKDEVTECFFEYKYDDECGPLPGFWDPDDKDSKRDREVLKPLAISYGVVVIIIIIGTLCHTVDEVTFSQSVCFGCAI